MKSAQTNTQPKPNDVSRPDYRGPNGAVGQAPNREELRAVFVRAVREAKKFEDITSAFKAFMQV